MNIQQAELDDARRGTIFFLGRLEATRRPSFDLGLLSNFVLDTGISTDLKHGAECLLGQFDAGKKVVEGFNTYLKPVKRLLERFFDTLTEHIAATYGEASAVLEWVGEFAAWGASVFAGSMADLVPGMGYIENAVDLFHGVKRAVSHCIDWLKQVYSGWGVALLEGGPSIMAQAIATHNAAGLAGGLKDIAIASVKTGLQAAGDSAGGAGSIFAVITGILQRIANMVNYAIQRFLINRTFNAAKSAWNTEGDILNNHNQFCRWFRQSTVCTPIIAALTLQSGYVANPLRFLALINDQGDTIKQDEYDKGVKHIEKLKQLSRDYVKSYADNYKLEFTAPNSEQVTAQLQTVFS